MMLKTNSQQGLSLVNVLVGVAIIIIAFIGIWNVFNFSLKIVADNKFRATATAIANEKTEIIRNLPYDDIATVGGIPAGSSPQTEIVTRNQVPFTVNTSIFYVDDPYDGTEGSGDLLAADYKKIKVSVDWEGRNFGEAVTSYTTVCPKGIETDIQGGTIRVIVFNASGTPIPEANVRVINNSFDNPVDTSSVTDQNGILLVPGATSTDDKSYEISVSKASYTSEKTYPENPPEFIQPTKPHVQVLEDQITEKSFTIDLVSTLNVTTLTEGYAPNWQINTASTSARQMNPDICVDDNNYYFFVWQDDKDTGSFRIYAQKYTSDQIPQWPEDVRISDANNQIVPRIATDGTNLYITWNKESTGNEESYITKIDSSGTELWGGKIDSPDPNQDQTEPAIAVSRANGDIFVTFQENSGTDDNWDIYAHKYDTDGDTAWTDAIKVNDDSTTTDQTYPQIAFYNDTTNDDKLVYITWQDYRNDDWDIYAHKYNSTSTSLWTDNLRVNTDSGSTTDQTAPEIVIDSLGSVYIVWQDNRAGNWDIYIHKYNAQAVAIWASEIKVNHDTGDANQTEPAVAIDSADNIYLSWTDERYLETQGKDIYAQKMDAGGSFLWDDDVSVVTNDPTGSDQTNSKIIIDQVDYIMYTWEDYRNEDTEVDIFVSRYLGPGASENIGNVPINIKGTKQIYDDPVILKFDNNYTTDGNGNFTLTDIEWDSYTIEPQSTSSYILLSSDPPQPIIIDPAETVDVELNVE